LIAVDISHLGALLPEIILMVGGLLIIVLDTALGEEGDSGIGFMVVSVVFLIVALIGAVFQLGIDPPAIFPLVQIDAFAAFMKIVVIAGMILVAIAGGVFMNQRIAGKGEFWALFMFVTLAMSLAVSAINLLLIFLAIEFLSITSYLLVGFLRETRRSTEAGVKYFLYGSVASAVMLYGFSFFYGATGSLDLYEIAATLATRPAMTTIILPAMVMVLVGLGFKTSLVPFHQWAPDTYDGAPTPITAYLSTASKATGFAVMARFFIVGLSGYHIDWVPVLTGLSILTMTVGNLIALRQTSVKRMLAYSSIAQAGYMLMGLTAVVGAQLAEVSTLAMNGLNGLMIYLFAYLFTNIGAFLVVMAVENETGSADISSFVGLGQRSPWLAWSMFVFLLSLTGIPLTGGFVGKFYVFGAAVQHQYFLLVFVAAINTAIAAVYYLNVVRVMFFPAADKEREFKPAALRVALAIQFVLIVCVAATLWLGIYPPNVIEWANDASQQLLSLQF
jgi:proton-translocating NADH-quinone oxidoreductase chain N